MTSGQVLRGKIQKIIGSLSQDISFHDDIGSTETTTAAASPRDDAEEERIQSILSILDSSSSAPRRSFDISGPSRMELLARTETLELEIAKLREQTQRDKSGHERVIEALQEGHRKEIEELEKTCSETVERNLEVIEKLVAEKKSSTCKLESLLAEREDLAKRLEAKSDTNKEIVKKMVAKERELIIHSEKVARAKWEQKKIEEIKRQTSRAIEPEIERLINTHKHEKRIIESKHVEDLERLKTEHLVDFNEKLRNAERDAAETVREALETERQLFAEKERNQFDSLCRQMEAERDTHLAELRRVRDESLTAERRLETELERIKEMHASVLAAKYQEIQDLRSTQKSSSIKLLEREHLQSLGEIEDRERVTITRLEMVVSETDSRLTDALNDRAVLRARVLELESKLTQHADVLGRTEAQSTDLRRSLDEIKLEKLDLIRRLKASEDHVAAFKSKELDRIEQYIHRIIKQKGDEISQLVEKVEYLQAKNKALNDLVNRTNS